MRKFIANTASELSESIERNGFGVILLNPECLEIARMLLDKAVSEMFEAPAGESLKWLSENCCAGKGRGLVSTGIIVKQPLSKDSYPLVTFGDSKVAFENNRIYADVNVSLWAHPLMDNPREIMQEYLGKGWHMSADFAKSVTYEAKKSDVKATPMHYDEYGVERLQGVINQDGETGLFFIPVNEKFRDTKKSGFVKCEGDIKDAFAPPPNSLVIWRSGTIHFEGVKGELDSNGMYRCASAGCTRGERLRFYTGFAKSSKQEYMEKLALLAELGCVPAYFGGINKGCEIDDLIVCRKTTMYKRPRSKNSDDEKVFACAHAVEQLSREQIRESLRSVTCQNKRWLYGVEW